MQQYRCIIVEDEPLAAEVLADYVRQVPFLSLAKICPDALFAIEYLQQEPVDLIFLDIHLPRLKGLDFIKTLQQPPAIIVTTAYHEYAVQGYELNVLDYLLKPIEFSRFLQAVNKLRQGQGRTTPTAPVVPGIPERPFLYFNVSKKKVRVFLDEILYIESIKEYIRIVTLRQSILTKFQLGQVEEMLTRNNFLRVHRSFIVSRDKIDAFTATDVEVNKHLIPIGRSYKEVVLAILDSSAAEPGQPA